MKGLQRLVVTVLLGVWFFPALSLAKPLPAPSAEIADSSAIERAPASPQTSGAAALAARESQAPDLQNFRGGGVEIYVGSGALLVIVIVLLIVLL